MRLFRNTPQRYSTWFHSLIVSAALCISAGCANTPYNDPDLALRNTAADYPSPAQSAQLDNLLRYAEQVQQLSPDERKAMLSYQRKHAADEESEFDGLKLGILLLAGANQPPALQRSRTLFKTFLENHVQQPGYASISSFVRLQLTYLEEKEENIKICEGLRIANEKLQTKINRIKLIENKINDREVDEIQIDK